IEPEITYRLIQGIGTEFNEIILFDDRDAVANTNEVEYALVNRFFTTVRASELKRKRKKRRGPTGRPSEMKTVRPDTEVVDKDKKKKTSTTSPASAGTPPPDSAAAPDQPRAQAEPNPDSASGQQSQSTQTPDKKSQLETGEQSELRKPNRDNNKDQSNQKGKDRQKNQAESLTGEDESPAQAYEIFTVKIAQKYFFDRNFGGALVEGQRTVFYPIDTLSGYSFSGHVRSFSPVNLAVRYRPLSTLFADVRMDISSDPGVIRDVTLSAGFKKHKFLIAADYNFSRQIKLTQSTFEPGTFPGDQVGTTVIYGDETRGWYGGTRISYDLTDRFITATDISRGRLTNSRSFV